MFKLAYTLLYVGFYIALQVKTHYNIVLRIVMKIAILFKGST